MKTKAKFDIYQTITDRIIRELEKGEIPWNKPWQGGDLDNLAWSRSTGKPYSLLNQMLLGKPGEWLTFKQTQEAGGSVRKGEKSSMVVFWKLINAKDKDTDEDIKIPYLKYYNVFHTSQCDGIEQKHDRAQEMTFNLHDDAETVLHTYLLNAGVRLTYDGAGKAYYAPLTDSIHLPLKKRFISQAEYYGTAFHECAHSTGHEDRLNRKLSSYAQSRESYSREELVAEITSAAILNRLGLETKGTMINTAAYCQSWLKALQDDKRAIVVATGAAEKAMQMIYPVTDEPKALSSDLAVLDLIPA